MYRWRVLATVRNGRGDIGNGRREGRELRDSENGRCRYEPADDARGGRRFPRTRRGTRASEEVIRDVLGFAVVEKNTLEWCRPWLSATVLSDICDRLSGRPLGRLTLRRS
jgi:hypothetical protein